ERERCADRRDRRGTLFRAKPGSPYPPSQSVLPSASRRKYIREPCTSQPRRAMSILTDVFERDARQVFAKLLPFPPSAAFAMFLRCRETIAIKRRANVTRRSFWKRIPLEERYDFWLAAQKGDHCLNKPRIFPIGAKGREPHLPIESRLMRLAPARRAHHIARFPLELVRFPIESIGAPFNHDLFAIFRHHSKQTVTVHEA